MSSRPPFHIWLKQARLALDLGRTELAGQVGCSLAMSRQLEYGKRRPSRELAHRLARYLHIPDDEREAFLRVARTPIHEAELEETGEPDAGRRRRSSRRSR